MKKIISLLILVIFLSNVVAAAIHPAVGTVVESGNGVSDAYVVVNCNSIVKTTYSISGGAYRVEYNDTECPEDSMVYVVASKDSYYGTASGPMHDFSVLTISIIDVFLFKVIEVIKSLRTFRKIGVPSIRVTEVVKAGDYLDVNVNIQNNGNRNMKEIRTSIIIPDLGLRKVIRGSKLKRGRDTIKQVKIFIPSDTLPGDYDVRISVSDGHVRQVKYRSFSVV